MKKLILAVLFAGLLCGQAQAQNDLNDFVGEKITYSIKQMGMKAGEATLSYEGPSSKEDKEYVLIVFKADGMNFLDFEKIYADPVTLMPKIVERDVNIFGKKEQITEYYDSDAGTVKIVKTVKGVKTEQVINKKGQLDNIYCFVYRYRRDKDPQPGDKLAVNLPTMDLQFMLKDKVKLSAAGKKYDAVFIQSDPAKYKIWFDLGKQKIPLRIDGAVGMGSTTMTMKSYETKSVFALLR